MLSGISYSQDIGVFGITHLFIYSVHMPVFMFLSGYCSRPNTSIFKIFKGCIIPYLIFDVLYIAFQNLCGIETSWNLLVPTYVYWYLMSLALIRLLIKLVPEKHFVALSVMCAVASLFFHFVDERVWKFMGIGRALLLFPIFIAGYIFKNKHNGTNRTSQIYALTLLIIPVVECILVYTDVLSVNWATHNQSVSFADGCIKLFLMLASAGLAIILINVIPNQKTRICRYGRNSLLVYAVHPFIVYIELVLLTKLQLNNPILLYGISLLSSVVVTEILSLDIFSKIYNYAVNSMCKILKIN